MKVLLLGSGAREHALAWKLAQSPSLDKLFAAPGNPGIAAHAELVGLDAADHAAVAAFCAEKSVSLVVIGPEQPLVDGLADSLRAAGVKVFGPAAAAAQLEGSKGFTKLLCAKAGIPTARFARASNLREAEAELDLFGLPVVIKADGLAAGKGVVIAQSAAEAEAAVGEMFAGSFGAAGACVVIEEFMEGEEVSFFALTDGETVVPFGSAQDHKRVGDGDLGSNTGGMGAYSPASIFTAELERRVLAEIVQPTVRALKAAGTPFSGVLYAGLMLTAEGPKLVEYNARFGDPECQVLMARLESDLLGLMLACAEGRLAEAPAPRFREEAALTVVMAARGYPGTPEKGGEIRGLDAVGGGALMFQAATAELDGALVANGGRVLSVTALGPDVGEAQARAYAAVDRIDFPSGFCRRDIGWREIARLAS
ncbi:MAG TPA: phosphoribosylamine--glycine ligase [Allosphingosinicella sp.]|nr:phosphoribosylamine--glycine ligase [Allosphingosinicella sp.]